jgi:dolichol kinase
VTRRAYSPSPLLSYVGVLTLGVGDALASIVGRQIGRRRWSRSSGKTVEGSIAFVCGIIGAVAAMRLVGIVPPVSVRVRLPRAVRRRLLTTVRTLSTAPQPWKLGVTSLVSALLEAVSNQNDNLEIPLYTWTVMSILGM